MFGWITENLGTILVSLALLTAVVFIILGMRRDKKQGKSSCPGGCSCGSCGSCASCGACKSCPSCSPRK